MKINNNLVLLKLTRDMPLVNGYYSKEYKTDEFDVVLNTKDNFQVGNGSTQGFISIKSDDGTEKKINVIGFSFLGD